MIKLNKPCNTAEQITNLKSVKSLNPTLSVTLGSTTDEPVHPMPEFPITQINYNNKQAYLNMQQSEELVYFIKHCHTLVFHLTTETKEIPTNTAFGQITYVCTQAASIAFFTTGATGSASVQICRHPTVCRLLTAVYQPHAASTGSLGIILLLVYFSHHFPSFNPFNHNLLTHHPAIQL